MDKQIAQLLLQVDANVAVAQRELQNLARVVKQSSGDMNSSLDSTVQAHARLGSAMGNTRIAQMELQHVITASSDAYAAGASPIRILSLEMGRLAEAAAFLGGSGGGGALGKLAGFMSSGWGVAVLIGVQVLGQLIQKHMAASDSVQDLVDKMRKHAEQAKESKLADDQWSSSIDGLIDRNTKLIDTLQKRLKAEEDLDAQTLRHAQGDKQKAEKDLADAKARLDRLKAQQASQDSATASPAGMRAESIAPVGQSNVLSSQIAQAEADVRKAQEAVAAAQGAIAQNTIAVGEAMGKAMADSSAQIHLWSKSYIEALHNIEQKSPEATAQIAGAFETLKKALEDAGSAKVPFKAAESQAIGLARDLNSGKITVAQYAAQMDKLAASLEAAAEAAKNAKKSTGEIGKQISFGDAEAIARGAGLTVTSGYRQQFGHGTPGHETQEDLYNNPAYNHPGNPVARPGTSAHGGINGKWALDIAFGPGITAESLKKLYGDQGVSLSAVYKESGHFHIEGSRSQAAARENAAARAAQKAQVDDDTFARESAQLDTQILQAKHQLAAGFDTQAKIATDEIDAEQKAQVAAVQKQVDAHTLTVAQGNILKSKLQELADAKKSAITEQQYRQVIEQTVRAMDQQYGFQLEDLKFADDQATTQADHRQIQLQILDIQYEQKKAELEYQLMLIQRNKDFAISPALQDDAANVQNQIDRLPTQKFQDQQRVNQGTLDPLSAWAKQVPQTAAQINEALKSIEAQGLDGLASAITDVITGTKSLKDAFGEVAKSIIADIIQMTVKMLIFRAISGLIGGGNIASPGVIGTGSFTSDFNPAALAAPLPHLASGGVFSVGGRGGVDHNLLSINGQGRAMVGADEQIAVIPKASRISMPTAANSNPPPPQRVIVELNDDMLDGRIAEGSNVQIARTYPAMKSAMMTSVHEINRRSSR